MIHEVTVTLASLYVCLFLFPPLSLSHSLSLSSGSMDLNNKEKRPETSATTASRRSVTSEALFDRFSGVILSDVNFA